MSYVAWLWDEIVEDITEAGERLASVAARPGSAGNISVFVPSLSCSLEPAERIELPAPAPSLAGGWVVITAAGDRLRDLARRPAEAIVALHIHLSGETATMHAARGIRPSSEWGSHLAIHEDHRNRSGVDHHAVLHAQPMRLVFLSHLPEISTTEELNERLMRWEPETAAIAHEDVELAVFHEPGSEGRTHGTVEALAHSNAVLWAKHGIVARSDASATEAADLIEYLEAAAAYEVMNLSIGSLAPGLDHEERAAVAHSLRVGA